jgi:hypothetical protein
LKLKIRRLLPEFCHSLQDGIRLLTNPCQFAFPKRFPHSRILDNN